MGNAVQCCHTLSNYFKCRDSPVQGEQERSLLLSSEESECDSPSLPENREEDPTSGYTNPTLEPENFLFPDIILSSSLGGDGTLVEPMVCLLVSEEEDGTGAGEPGQEARGRGSGGCYEAETQTEVETQITTGVQTQTEFHRHSETLGHRHSNLGREASTLVKTVGANEDERVTRVGTRAEHHAQLITQQDTDFMLQHNSDFTWASPTPAMEADDRQKLVQTKGKDLSEGQTVDQIKGAENLHQTPGAKQTGLLDQEEGDAGMKSRALLSLDRLFLTGLRRKSRWTH